jgi:hypothetical protein
MRGAARLLNGKGLTAEGCVVVIGADGGICGTHVNALEASAKYARLHALSRPPLAPVGLVEAGTIDVTDERSIENAAEQVGGRHDLMLIATGMLHHAGLMPEKAIRDLDGPELSCIFEANSIGEALSRRGRSASRP